MLFGSRSLLQATGLLAAGAALLPALRLLRRLLVPQALPLPLSFSTCRVHRIKSIKGLPYKLLVSLPHGYDDAAQGKKHYPVLIVLDAEPYLFPLLTVVARTNHFFAQSYYYPDAIVVGVVADLERERRFHCGPWWRLNVPLCWQEQRPTRARDYLPTSAESPWGGPNAPSLLGISGHADAFVDFVVDALVPFVDATYRTHAAAARAIIGKSFGGSGVAAAMLHSKGASAFSEFVLGSPSIAWDNNAWFRLEADARAASAPGGGSPPFGADVFCCVGEKEGGAELVLRMKDVLDDRDGRKGEVAVEVVPNETHGSVSFPFVHKSMDWLRPRWAKVDANENDDAKARKLVNELAGNGLDKA